MSARWTSDEADEEEELIGSSFSKQSSSECQPSKIKKKTPKSVREIAEKIKQSINNKMIVKLGEGKMPTDAELTDTDWTTVCVKTVVSDRTVEVRSLSPKKSSSSRSSSGATNWRGTFFSTPSAEGQKSAKTSSSPLCLPDMGQKLLSSTRIHTPDTPITRKTNFSGENSKITKKREDIEKNEKASKNRKSSVESKKRDGTSSSLPLDLLDSNRTTRVKNPSTKNSQKIIDENWQITRRNKRSSKNHGEKDLSSPSPSSDVLSAKNIFSSTRVQRKIPASTERRQNGRENNCQTERDENVERETFHAKANKSNWKEKLDEILDLSNNVEDDFTRDVEVTREALPIVDDIAELDEPLTLKIQHLGVPEECEETTGAELPIIDSRLEVPTTREKRFNDESIDRSDDDSCDSGELHVCRDNLKTYPPRWADVIYIGMRAPRIVKRPDDFFRMFEKSLVIPSPTQTRSPPKIKFHPSENYRANQLWDEFVSNNPEIFARNASSHTPRTNEEQNTRKRKIFKTDRNTRLGLDKSETHEVPVPAKKQKKSRRKRARKVESSSSSPNMVMVDGELDFGIKDRNVYEISSDSDDECVVFPQKSADQTHRWRTARDRYDRLTEIEGGSAEASIEDFPSQCRSPSRRHRQERTKQATKKRSKKPIIEDQYRSSSPDRRSSTLRRSRFDDRVENQSSNVKDETVTDEDRHSKRKINEASGSRSVTANDRRPKRLGLEDGMKNWNEYGMMRSSEVREEAATAEDRRSKRKITEASRSRSVSGNDRQPKRLGFVERMRRFKSTAASSSVIVRSPGFCDPFCDLDAQKDRKTVESTIDKCPDFVKSARARKGVVNPLTGKIRSMKTKTNDSAVSRTRIGEASGSRSVLGSDRGRKILPFEEKMQKTKSTAASSSAIIGSPRLCDDPFCDLGALKDRKTAESTIDKCPDFMAGARPRSRVVNPPTERISFRKTETNESAASRTRGKSREIESLYDERSVIVDLNSTKPRRKLKTAETMDFIIEETAIRDFPENSRNRGDSPTTNRTILPSIRSVPIIRSDVALPAGRISRIGNGRWEIVQPSTSAK